MLLQTYAGDSATALTAGTVANVSLGGGYQIIVLAATILAPLLKELVFILIKKLKKYESSGTTEGNK